jgi:hypothetical protein
VPFYLFIDDGMTLVASNYVGDADWLSFAGQMREPEAGEAGGKFR